MSETKLIPVRKGGETIRVHPAGLADHKRLGWVVVEGEPEPVVAVQASEPETQPDAPQTDAAIEAQAEQPRRRGRPPKIRE